MGSDNPRSYQSDGEGPVREVVVEPFSISATALPMSLVSTSGSALSSDLAGYTLNSSDTSIWNTPSLPFLPEIRPSLTALDIVGLDLPVILDA